MTTRLMIKTKSCEALVDVVYDDSNIKDMKFIGIIDKEIKLIAPDDFMLEEIKEAIINKIGLL